MAGGGVYKLIVHNAHLDTLVDVSAELLSITESVGRYVRYQEEQLQQLAQESIQTRWTRGDDVVFPNISHVHVMHFFLDESDDVRGALVPRTVIENKSATYNVKQRLFLKLLWLDAVVRRLIILSIASKHTFALKVLHSVLVHNCSFYTALLQIVNDNPDYYYDAIEGLVAGRHSLTVSSTDAPFCDSAE